MHDKQEIFLPFFVSKALADKDIDVASYNLHLSTKIWQESFSDSVNRNKVEHFRRKKCEKRTGG